MHDALAILCIRIECGCSRRARVAAAWLRRAMTSRHCPPGLFLSSVQLLLQLAAGGWWC